MRLDGFIKKLAGLCLIAALFYAATMLVGDDKEAKKAAPSAPSPAVSEEEKAGNTLVSVEGFRMVDSDFNRIKMEVSARKAELVNRRFRQFRLAIGNVVELEKPDIRVHDDSGGKTVITSAKATLDPAKKEILFVDGCTVSAPDGTRLTSDAAAWKYSRGFLEVRGEYVITRAGRETRGRNSYIDLGLNKFKAIL